MKTLIISDIHANLIALQAVLADAGDYDRVISLGDVANFGPFPSECVNLLKSIDPICVMGNHDKQILTDSHQNFWDRWSRQRLNENQLSWMSTFVHHAVIDDHILIIHGGTSTEYDVVPNTSPADVKALFSNLLSPIIDEVWFGHYHYDFECVVDDVRYKCFRPVGQHRDNDTRASYYIYDDGVLTHHKVEYNIDLAINALKQENCFENESDRDVFIDFLKNAYSDVLLKKDIKQIRINELSQLYSKIQDNPEACREEGNRLLFLRDATSVDKQWGIRMLERAVSLKDNEAIYLKGLLLVNEILKIPRGDSVEYGLLLINAAANRGVVSARLYLNNYCKEKYDLKVTSKFVNLKTDKPLTDFRGKKIKIDRKGILTPIDANLQFVDGSNILTFSTNVVFWDQSDGLSNNDLFKKAVCDGFKEWEGDYTVFGGQKLRVNINLTFDRRIFDNIIVMPVSDDINDQVTDFWNKYGTEKIKDRVNNTLGNKRSLASIGIARWSVHSRKCIFIQSEDGEFDDYEEIKSVAKHEFGHALGLGDLYRSPSDGLAGVAKGSYVETDSYYIANDFYNLVMCDHHGPISNNDIEMVVLAFSKNSFQKYQRDRKNGKISEALGKGN